MPAPQVLTTKDSLQPRLPCALSLSYWPGIASFGARVIYLRRCVNWVVQILGLFPSNLKERKQQWVLGGPVAAQGGQCCKLRNVFGLRLRMKQGFRSDSYQPGFLETGVGAGPVYSFTARNSCPGMRILGSAHGPCRKSARKVYGIFGEDRIWAKEAKGLEGLGGLVSPQPTAPCPSPVASWTQWLILWLSLEQHWAQTASSSL